MTTPDRPAVDRLIELAEKITTQLERVQLRADGWIRL